MMANSQINQLTHCCNILNLATVGQIFKLIWRGLDRLRYFLWKLVREVLLTNVEIIRRKLIDNDGFPGCNTEP